MPASLPDNHDLKAILEHVRGQFQYHATQRLSMIRYFFVTYAVFVAAYLGVITNKHGDPLPAYTSLVLSMMATVVTFSFWILDARNAQLVSVNEQGVTEIERLVATKYELCHFKMTERSEMPGQCFKKYSFVMPVLFGTFAIVSTSAVVREIFFK